jgi:hypothetical protein
MTQFANNRTDILESVLIRPGVAKAVAVAITPQFLADITVCSLSEEERLLPFGIRGFRECDVQFLLWRKLLLLGYKASMEEKRIDIAIFDDQQMIAAIELKGPWLAKKFRFPNSFAGLFETDFGKLFCRISANLSGQCYCLWTFAGPDETAIQDAFDKFLECARTAAPDCLVESARSSLLNLDKHGDSRWRVCGVYAVRVYKDSTETAVT